MGLVRGNAAFAKYVLLLLLLPAWVKSQGLQFNANDSLLIKRTSYNVFNSDNTIFSHYLLISFDLSIWDKSNLGYIINVADKENSYSLSYLFDNGAGYLNFNIDARSNKIKIPLPSSFLARKKWMKVVMKFDLDKDAIYITVNNKNYQADKLGLHGSIQARLTFGKNPLYTEVPHIAVKNLSVGDYSKKYFFPLNEWNGNNVHDKDGNVIGYVENPFWLANESYFWKPVFTRSFKQVAGLNFNPPDQNLSVFSKDSLITYNAKNKDLVTRPYKNAMPVNMVLGKNIINIKENKAYIYELFDVQAGQPSIASLDLNLNNLEWKTVGKATWSNQLHHHNVFYDAAGDTIYLFGGYGAFKYHNSFLFYDRRSDKWLPQIFTGDKITPRFFAATGPSDRPGEIFLFGGYGNESGNQVVGGRQYYDLYRINLQNHHIKKCWETKPDSGMFVPANNLVLSPDKKFFYALCYPHEVAKTELSLYKFSIEDGTYEIVSAPIPVTSERIESDMNLFYDSHTNEFFCTEQEFADRNSSTIKLFSLEGPPLSRALYQQSLNPEKPSKNYAAYIIAGGLIIAVVAAFTAIVFVRRKKSGAGVEEAVEPLKMPAIAEAEAEATGNEPEEAVPVISEKTQNAVYLLGDFLVYDAKALDISHLFSPKIKQLFVLILLNSINGEGISSKKISAILWPDKELSKTKNIRGVTFNHLRNAISNIHGLELLFSGDNYFFKLEDNVFCDYADVLKSLNSNHLSAENLAVVLRGGLLPEMQDVWLEKYKYRYEQRLINLLTTQVKQAYEANDLKQALEISRHILKIEPFNEEAIKYEIAALKKLKGARYARKVFDQYADEYKRSLGDDCPVRFDNILI
ncbi:hypothetical protein [Parafilimonas sp.]|uniref:hypothetical protein n=1 Tax=Parafilimonas sp. TaxID=1969739 RepID=UPI0039E48837